MSLLGQSELIIYIYIYVCMYYHVDHHASDVGQREVRDDSLLALAIRSRQGGFGGIGLKNDVIMSDHDGLRVA